MARNKEIQNESILKTITQKEEETNETLEERLKKLEKEKALLEERLKTEQQKEAKSRRLQVVLKPTTYDKIKAYAINNNVSVNEAIQIAILNLTLDL